eukprot:CAMPEP_0201571880 /NCGR_PEP_ID=MMETSP0190_2-20130828/14856_1 /ASSEMBLY_ACC=CAM_ASM_000263 /TAXON_ID=37353 /ORGANISM="Rosalina sp." /LENGTH=478 /DNA_ID=CAMNT_0047997017 /DNA_START=74 /DNA_END=1510 /DNA_ORIENTATION=+
MMLQFFMISLLILISKSLEAIPLSTQVHIGLIPPDQMSISWVTLAPYTTTTPIVYLSSTPNITNNATQISVTTQSDGGINRYYHHGITPQLTPLKQYYYQPGPNASIYTFIARNTAPLNSDNENSDTDTDTASDPVVKFLAYGDLGIKNSENTIDLIKSLTKVNGNAASTTDIDFILHFGDVAYADDRDIVFPPSNPEYAQIYDDWGNIMEPIFSKIPYMTAPGNHEQTCHSWSDWHCHTDLENFTVYREYFRMPLAKNNEMGGGNFNMWWSMDYKNIHILSISTETDYPGSPDQGGYHNDFINPEAGPFGDQMKFVENDLKQAFENKDIKWIIVNGHRPYYTSAHDDDHLDWPPQTPFVLREAFEPLFYKYNVDLYISGHIHGYERLYSIYKEDIITKDYMNPGATIYFVAGGAGNIEGHSSTVPKKNYTAVYNNRQYGVSQVSILNDTYLLWEYYAAENNSVIDSVTIKKGNWAHN